MTKIISISNQKGGVGKTTTTINLAACVAERGRQVLVVDLDPQANATSGLGVEKIEGGSMYEVLLGGARMADKIQPTGWKNLSIVPSEINLAGSEIDIARQEHYLTVLRDAIRPVVESQAYDVIFCDCPPAIGVLTMNALTASDSIIVPFQCEYYALEGFTVIVDVIKKIRASGANPKLQIEGIVMTMYDGRTNLSRSVVEEVRALFKDAVYKTMIPRSVRLGEAPSYGEPIIEYDPRSAGATAYRELAREFLRRL